MKRVSLGAGSALLFVASAAAAHPGHGITPDGWLHWVSEPLHVAPLAVIGLALGLAWRRQARVRVPTR